MHYPCCFPHPCAAPPQCSCPYAAASFGLEPMHASAPADPTARYQRAAIDCPHHADGAARSLGYVLLARVAQQHQQWEDACIWLEYAISAASRGSALWLECNRQLITLLAHVAPHDQQRLTARSKDVARYSTW